MRLISFLLGIVFLCSCFRAEPQQSSISPATQEAISHLLGDTMLHGQAYEYDRQLADDIGPRLTGSENYMRAASWAEQQFRAIGLVNVHRELWTIPATWEPEEAATGSITAPIAHTLHIYASGWSCSTPKGGVEGRLVYLSSLTRSALDGQRATLSGAIVLLDAGRFADTPTLDELFSALEQLRSFSPSAILFAGGPNGTETLDAYTFSGRITSIPEAQIGLEDALLIERLLEKGPVTLRFSMKNRSRTNAQIPNIVAEIPGSEYPDEVVLVGAHLDSWQPGTGAQDDGTGVAAVLETARAILALHHPSRRTIRFVLFGGEEQGMLGSTAYVRQHSAELGHIDAVLITDSGSEPAKGWYLLGREDEKPAVDKLKPLLAGLGSDGTTSDTEFVFEADNAAFEVAGVPALFLWTDMTKYMGLHHKASDTFDSVVQKDLTQGTATLAVTAYAIADSETPFAEHLSTDQVEAMLKQAHQLEVYLYMKQVGALP